LANDVNTRRKYVSPHRQEQAARTREAVLEAALKSFSEGGWTSTTIAAIAREAGVSKETIYSIWRTKTAIVAELVQRAIRGGQPDVPLLGQSGPKQVAAAPTAERRIDIFANDIAEVLGRVAPLVDAIRTSAATDPDSAALYATLHAGRRRNLTEVAKVLAPDLRAGLSVEDATEHIWRQASPELLLLLTRQDGYDSERYSAWLADALKRLLLKHLRD
jgi:AcrR family transcriptional regulator